MNEHERKMYADHDALKREERIVTAVFRVGAIIAGLLATLAAVGGWA
jgi:hypothetical protein